MRIQISRIICVAALLFLGASVLDGQTKQDQGARDVLKKEQDIFELQRLQYIRRVQEMRIVEIQKVYDMQNAYYSLSRAGVLSSDPHQLIHNSQVRRELELDRDQIKELAEIQKNYQRQIQDGMKQAKKGKAFDSKKWNETIQRLSKEHKSALGAVLLPHQSKRLKQISTQLEMKNKGDSNAIIGKTMADELGIDQEQKKRIQKRAAEIKLSLEEKIAKLKEEARKELLQELSQNQRSRLKEMIGEKFEARKPNRSKK